MIKVEVEKNSLEQVQKKLGTMKSKARPVIRSAVNTTATQARQMLLAQAQSRYSVKRAGFNKSAKLIRATTANLTAYIKSTGSPIAVTKFKYSAPKSGGKAAVLASSGLKQLVNGSGNKAFKYNGNLFQRRGDERFPLRAAIGPSAPKMIEKVYDGAGTRALKTEINKMLQANIEKKIAEVTVAEQNLPKRESEEDDDPFPYIIVRLSEGQIASQADAYAVDTYLLIGAYDGSTENNGHRTVMEIIEKIQQRYEENPCLAGKYVLQDPVSWALQDEESWPYFFGAMSLTWSATAPRRKGSTVYDEVPESIKEAAATAPFLPSLCVPISGLADALNQIAQEHGAIYTFYKQALAFSA